MIDDQYIKDLQVCLPLSREEEHALAIRKDTARYRKHRLEARNKLVEANLRWVIKIADKYTGYGLSLEDLVQEGNDGLIYAVDKFNPAFGNRVTTYATSWIRNRMQRALAKRGLIHVPAQSYGLIKALTEAREDLLTTNTVPTVEQLSEKLDSKPAKIANTVKMEHAGSIQNMGCGESEIQTALHNFSAYTETHYDDDLDHKVMIADVDACLSQITSNQRFVIRRRYCYGAEFARLHEIGKMLNLTKERARQLEQEGLIALKEKLITRIERRRRSIAKEQQLCSKS